MMKGSGGNVPALIRDKDGADASRGGYGMQDPGLLGNGLLGNSLANQLGAANLADSLGLTQGLSAIPAPQNLGPGGPGGGLGGFNNMGGLGNGQHAADALAQVLSMACQRLLVRMVVLNTKSKHKYFLGDLQLT